jgi:hypothetical protein
MTKPNILLAFPQMFIDLDMAHIRRKISAWTAANIEFEDVKQVVENAIPEFGFITQVGGEKINLASNGSKFYFVCNRSSNLPFNWILTVDTEHGYINIAFKGSKHERQIRASPDQITMQEMEDIEGFVDA